MSIATKLLFLKVRSYADFDKLFNTQLEHLKTDYIDYYLIHNISSLELWHELINIGIEKWLTEKKMSGKIKQVVFSFHGAQDGFLELLDAYNWDFTQIQYNYMNESIRIIYHRLYNNSIFTFKNRVYIGTVFK